MELQPAHFLQAVNAVAFKAHFLPARKIAHGIHINRFSNIARLILLPRQHRKGGKQREVTLIAVGLFVVFSKECLRVTLQQLIQADDFCLRRQERKRRLLRRRAKTNPPAQLCHLLFHPALPLEDRTFANCKSVSTTVSRG